MSDAVITAVISLVGTVVTAAATVSAAYARNVARSVGKPNGRGDIVGQLDSFLRILETHIQSDAQAFSSINEQLGRIERRIERCLN